MRVLVLGGARSGKSSYGESLLYSHEQVTYIATARPYPADNPEEAHQFDQEFSRRIARHRRSRPSHWHTEEQRDLIEVLHNPPSTSLLVDDLSSWLSHKLNILDLWDTDEQEDTLLKITGCYDLIQAIESCPQPLVMISPEVGMGISPAYSSGRLFRDLLGNLNAKIAQVSDSVFFVTAGLPLQLK